MSKKRNRKPEPPEVVIPHHVAVLLFKSHLVARQPEAKKHA